MSEATNYHLQLNNNSTFEKAELYAISNKQERLEKINLILEDSKQNSFIRFNKTGEFLLNIVVDFGCKTEVEHICKQYIDNRINRIKSFISNYSKYEKQLESFIGVAPDLNITDDDSFIERYLKRNNWIGEEQLSEYTSAKLSLTGLVRVFEEYKVFEDQLMKTLKKCKINSDKEEAEMIIRRRIHTERKAILNWKKSRIYLGGDANTFTPNISIKTGLMQTFLETLGIYVSDKGEIKYADVNFFNA